MAVLSDGIRDSYGLSDDAEVTMEMDPGDGLMVMCCLLLMRWASRFLDQARLTRRGSRAILARV